MELGGCTMSNIRQHFTSRFDGGYIMEFDFCVVPTTKILTHDFKYVPISSVSVGDELVGFDEDISKYGQTKFRKTIVERVETLYRPCKVIEFDDGTAVTSSIDHQWVCRRRKTGYKNTWHKTEDIDIGYVFPQVLDVWDDKSQTPDGAYMAGFLDGEGWITNSSFGVGQNVDATHQCVWDKFLPILRETFPSIAYNANDPEKCGGSSCVQARPMGLRTAWTAVGTWQPVRLKQKLQSTYEGTAIRSRCNKQRTVINVKDAYREVVAVRTSTKTYRAEGMLSHNCQLEVIALAFL